MSRTAQNREKIGHRTAIDFNVALESLDRMGRGGDVRICALAARPIFTSRDAVSDGLQSPRLTADV